ncbi:hypothetical protein GGS21DRAFT_534247 [Xylaria nigripes]|nr:hypothetical protein GGS21DRAFT_534247 [Xylaria nigripes]
MIPTSVLDSRFSSFALFLVPRSLFGTDCSIVDMFCLYTTFDHLTDSAEQRVLCSWNRGYRMISRLGKRTAKMAIVRSTSIIMRLPPPAIRNQAGEKHQHAQSRSSSISRGGPPPDTPFSPHILSFTAYRKLTISL